ncbi:MAG: ComEC/Rec2 family competence protein [Caldilineaceae bacterium]
MLRSRPAHALLDALRIWPITTCSPTGPIDRAAAPTVTVQGFISSYPLASDTKQRLEVTAASITAVCDAAGRGYAAAQHRVHAASTAKMVRLRGRLVTPPDFEDFSYREYLARKGIHSLMYGAEIDILPGPPAGNPVLRGLYAFRARGEALLNRQLPEPYAALANGMLLGIEAGIPDDLYDQFNLTGTSHVIVISGSNVALIAGVLLAVGTRLFGRRYAVIPALIGIAAFALLVGGDAAVMRAALMGGLFVYATSIGRRSTALVSLALACWIMTLANPLTLWDVGFQLSSAATAGLILLAHGHRDVRPRSPRHRRAAHQCSFGANDTGRRAHGAGGPGARRPSAA